MQQLSDPTITTPSMVLLMQIVCDITFDNWWSFEWYELVMLDETKTLMLTHVTFHPVLLSQIEQL